MGGPISPCSHSALLGISQETDNRNSGIEMFESEGTQPSGPEKSKPNREQGSLEGRRPESLPGRG